MRGENNRRRLSGIHKRQSDRAPVGQWIARNEAIIFDGRGAEKQ